MVEGRGGERRVGSPGRVALFDDDLIGSHAQTRRDAHANTRTEPTSGRRTRRSGSAQGSEEEESGSTSSLGANLKRYLRAMTLT